MATVSWRSAAPLDLLLSLARHQRWGGDPVNRVGDGGYTRVIRGSNGGFPYRARQDPNGGVHVSAPSLHEAETAAADLRHRLAEELPRQPLVELAERDRVVGSLLAERPGYRPPLEPDPFEALVTAISAQQINLRFATTTRRRLVERFGVAHRWRGDTWWEFPTPASLAAADPEELRALQFSRRKAEYVIGVAQAAEKGRLAGLGDLADEDVVARVTALRGVGRWSADWLLARCLARPRAVAAGDLGVRKAVSRHYLGREDLLPEDEIRRVAAGWGDAANWTTHLLLERMATR